MTDDIRLIDIIDEFISGDWGDEVASADSPCAVSCIRGADIVPITNSHFGDIPIRYISASSLKNRKLSEGDIIIEKSGGSPTQSTGRTVYVSKELVEAKNNIVCSNFCQAFRIKPEWNPLYVYYYLQVVYNSGIFFNFEGKTSGLKNLILDSAFQSIKIKPIPLTEQERIAKAISLTDKKIAANYAMDHNLEAIAHQLYDYWFIQFDFPDANGKPYKSSGGKLVYDSNLKRDIPYGWNSVKLTDIANITMGQSPDGKSYNNDGKGTVFFQGSTDFGEFAPEVRMYTTEPSRMAKAGDILMSVRAPVGTLNMSSTDCCVGRGLAALSPKIGSATYLYYVLHYAKSYFDMLNSNGTTFGAITKDDLYSVKTIIPDSAVLKKFESLCSKIMEERFKLFKENLELAKLKETILPLLMNGQASIS